MSLTVKELLEKKYNLLLKEIEPIIDSDLLPKLDEDFDWKQYFQFINFVFPDKEYEFHIEGLSVLKGISITSVQIKRLVPIVSKYMIWVEKFQKVYPEFK